MVPKRFSTEWNSAVAGKGCSGSVWSTTPLGFDSLPRSAWSTLLHVVPLTLQGEETKWIVFLLWSHSLCTYKSSFWRLEMCACVESGIRQHEICFLFSRFGFSTTETHMRTGTESIVLTGCFHCRHFKCCESEVDVSAKCRLPWVLSTKHPLPTGWDWRYCPTTDHPEPTPMIPDHQAPCEGSLLLCSRCFKLGLTLKG